MDATAWGAIGGGLSALSEGLTAMQLRKLAKQREDEERERQKEEAALRKAQLKAQEFQNMDARNFKKVSENGQITNKANANALLNAAAFGRGGEQVKGDISGDTYFRGAGESPADQKRQNEEDKREAALEAIRVRTEMQRQIDAARGERDLYKWGTPSGNNTATNANRLQGLQITVGGANTRAGASEANDLISQKRQHMIELMRPTRNEDGSTSRMSAAEAKAIVDDLYGNPGGEQKRSGGRTEQEESMRAQQKIAEIQADVSLPPEDKAARIGQVNQILARNIQKIRSGGM